MQQVDQVAKAIYWVYFGLCENLVADKPSKDEAWEMTSEEHRELCRAQARAAIEAMSPEPTPMSDVGDPIHGVSPPR